MPSQRRGGENKIVWKAMPLLHQLTPQKRLNRSQAWKTEMSSRQQQESDLDTLKVGSAGIQDLLMVMQKADLQDALPRVVLLLELAVVLPLTSVHCERVFSRMKRVAAPERSCMLQSRKNHLVLQVEHKLLRWLADKPDFHQSVVMRFKMKIMIVFESKILYFIGNRPSQDMLVN